MYIDYEHKARGTAPAASPEGVAMFANISTKELFEMNTTYTREWMADKDHTGKRQAVINTGAELTARGAW